MLLILYSAVPAELNAPQFLMLMVIVVDARMSIIVTLPLICVHCACVNVCYRVRLQLFLLMLLYIEALDQ